MLPRVSPPDLILSMMERIWLSSHGIFGPPISTWSTPSCFTRRMPPESGRPAERLPARLSRQILGVSPASARGPGICAPGAACADNAPAPMARMIFLRDKSDRMKPPPCTDKVWHQRRHVTRSGAPEQVHPAVRSDSPRVRVPLLCPANVHAEIPTAPAG